MAVGLARRVRKLSLARGLGGRGPLGVCWCDDPPRPESSGRLVLDYRIVQHEEFFSESRGTWREALGDDDHGTIFAWDGRVIGRLEPVPGGRPILRYVWPAGLGRDPAIVAPVVDPVPARKPDCVFPAECPCDECRRR